MELPSRPKGDELLPPGEYGRLRDRLRRVAPAHDLAAVVAGAFDPHRYFPAERLSHRTPITRDAGPAAFSLTRDAGIVYSAALRGARSSVG